MSDIVDMQYFKFLNMLAGNVEELKTEIFDNIVPLIKIIPRSDDFDHITIYPNAVVIWTKKDNYISGHTYYNKLLIATCFALLEDFFNDVYKKFKKLTDIVYDAKYIKENITEFKHIFRTYTLIKN